jgi:hypothetical protein
VQQLVRNADFRKFDDGLRMTLDCTPAFADRIDALLARGEESGSDHVHFVDGASGGYAAAARALKMPD